MVNVKCGFHYRSDDDGENVYRSLMIDAFRFAEPNDGKPPNGMLIYLVGMSDSRLNKQRQQAQEMQNFFNEYYESQEMESKATGGICAN